MHDQHTCSAQAFASMAWELNKKTWPVDGDDEHLSDIVGGTAHIFPCPSYDLSRCPSFASTSITPALVDVATGDIHDEPEWKGNECSDGVWEGITRGDGDTTRGDGDAEDTGEPPRRGHDGHFGVATANWGGHWGDVYLEERLGRGCIDTIHGGGVIMFAQTNDTDHHEHVLKRYIELQTELMMLGDIYAAKTDALSLLMEKEKQRVLGVVPALVVPAAPGG